MTLNKKVLLIVGFTTLVLIAALHFSSRIFLLGSFAKIEERHAEENLQRILSAIDNDVSVLNALAYDWAAWDDSYEFIVDVNQKYIETNLPDEMFGPTRLSVVAAR
jgi:sensor domain CHASE-containing protein